MNPLPANPYTLPTINFVGGSTQDLAFHAYYKGNGEPFDLASCDASFAVINYVNKTGTPLIKKAMTVDENAATANTLRVTLRPEDTVDLAGKFIYQITIRDDTEAVDIPQQGIMMITNNIDKDFIREQG